MKLWGQNIWEANSDCTFSFVTMRYPLPKFVPLPQFFSLWYIIWAGSVKQNFVCSQFQVDFDEWSVCGRFVVKPHVDSTLDESKYPIGSFVTL